MANKFSNLRATIKHWRPFGDFPHIVAHLTEEQMLKMPSNPETLKFMDVLYEDMTIVRFTFYPLISTNPTLSVVAHDITEALFMIEEDYKIKLEKVTEEFFIHNEKDFPYTTTTYELVLSPLFLRDLNGILQKQFFKKFINHE